MKSFIRRPILLATLVAGGFPVLAQAQAAPSALPRDSVKLVLIRQLIKEAHTGDQTIATMELTLPSQRSANPRIPAVFWDRFIAQARSRKGEFEDMVAVIYDRHFTTDELRQIHDFYQTPVGRKMLETLPALTRESMLAGQDWGRRIGEDVGKQLAAEGVKFEP
jgi:hypothetical protein